jgi:PadR family transcriptional regulator AphA
MTVRDEAAATLDAVSARPRKASAPPGPTSAQTAAGELPLAEAVCLAIVAEGPTHGWRVGTLLATDGEVGRIWSLSRPLTYRALEQLTEKRLVRRTAPGVSSGRERQLLHATPRGRRVAASWLDAPIEHLREVRTELLLKLTLRQRAALDVGPLLEAQQQRFAERIATLTGGGAPTDLVALWRRESARAVRRFLDAALNPPAEQPSADSLAVRISAPNQIRATVTAITHGDVMSTVKATLGDGQSITAAITKESVDDLDLAHGDEVIVVVKSTEVMIAKP